MDLSVRPQATFLQDLSSTIQDPSGRLAVPSTLLLQALSRAQVTEIIAKDLPKKPSMWNHLGAILTSSAGGSEKRHPFDIMPSSQAMSGWGTVLTHSIDSYKYTKQSNTTFALLDAFVLQRETIGLTEREKALLRAMGALYAEGLVSPQEWAVFLSRMVWNDGKSVLKLPKAMAGNTYAPFAREMLLKVLKSTLEGHQQFIEETTQTVAAHRGGASRIGAAINDALYQGARWLRPEDLASSRVYSRSFDPASLIIGYHRESGEPVAYSGDASLITVAAPGTGKTQAQVIPNLLTYPGSVFVLDVKGELWSATAAYRQANFGPVYRFSPTAIDGRSHSYNPFDMISNDPVLAADGCQVLADQLVPENPRAKEPFWDKRARGFVWAFAMLVALDVEPRNRTLATLVSNLSTKIMFAEDEVIVGTSTDVLINRLNDLGCRVQMPALSGFAGDFRDGLNDTRHASIMDTARSHLDALSRTPSAAAATRQSDWTPHALRQTPGTSIYLSFKPGEMRAYAGIIRLLLQQHANALTRDFAHGEAPPITFFLDELPQLGNMASLNDLLDLGRGAGLRLWMFAQYLGQLRDAYGSRADGIVGSTQIRCFMQPDNDAAKFIQPQLGKTRNIISGEERPLAEAHELSSRTYGDHMIVLARNEHPVLLTKRLAYQTMAERMRAPPPEVPRVL